MPRDARRIPITIENPVEGCRDITSLAHARRYIKRGVAEMVGGKLRFIHRHTEISAHGPAIDIAPWREIRDSGHSGFARYPLFGIATFKRTTIYVKAA